MKIAGEYTFDAPQDVVWEALQDPAVLASIMPGCEALNEIGENEYEGALKIKVGPVQGSFKGKVHLTDIVPPDSYSIVVDGRGGPGFMKGSGGLQLADQGEKTLMTYEGDAQVGGRIASVGQRLIDSSAKSIIKQSLEALNLVLQAKMAATAAATADQPADPAGDASAEVSDGASSAVSNEAPPTPVPPPPPVQAPSQIEFAANVAKDVAGDLIPARYRPAVIGGGVVIVAAIIYLLFR